MIVEILQRQELLEEPPVLLDIGASGDLPSFWKDISKYSICLAFDGDDRDFAYIEERKKQFKKLIIVNKIVSHSEGEIDFYLTRSPYCSSTLKPDLDNLSNYAFARLFEIDRIIKLQGVTLPSILSDHEITYIDWLKTDTQGTDLRIIKSLDEFFLKKVLLFELEPGIIDAYQNEDKFYTVLEFFNHLGFIVLDAQIKGSYRINLELFKDLLTQQALQNVGAFLPATPDWCEVTFFNPLEEILSVREYLLAWVFAIIKKQYGLALEIAQKGFTASNDDIFTRMIDYTANEINSHFNISGKKTIKQRIKRRLVHLIERI